MTPTNLTALALSVKVAKEYVDLIVKPTFSEVGNWLAEKVGSWKQTNQVKVVLKAKELCEERGVQTEQIQPSIFVPLIEAAATVDDPNLSEMFAQLLASHLDPTQQNTVHPAFAKVLGQLAPLDAQVMRLIDEKEQHSSTEGWATSKLIVKVIDRFNDANPQEIVLSLSNLERLGLLVDTSEHGRDGLPPFGWALSDFGVRFLVACSGDDYWRGLPDLA